MSELKGYGICKECNAGTLNNLLNTKFGLADGIDGESEIAVCLTCGGSHIGGELYIQSDVHPGDAADAEVEEEEVIEDEAGDPYSDEAYENEVGS